MIRLVVNRELKDRFVYIKCPFVAMKGVLKIKVVIPRLGREGFYGVDGVYHVKVKGKVYLGSKEGKGDP